MLYEEAAGPTPTIDGCWCINMVCDVRLRVESFVVSLSLGGVPAKARSAVAISAQVSVVGIISSSKSCKSRFISEKQKRETFLNLSLSV